MRQAAAFSKPKGAVRAGERDDLKGLLVATLQRLEAVDDVVRRADMANAVMEERVGVLEQERSAALESASAAQARVDEMVKSQRRIEWQNKVPSLPCSCPCLLRGHTPFASAQDPWSQLYNSAFETVSRTRCAFLACFTHECVLQQRHVISTGTASYASPSRNVLMSQIQPAMTTALHQGCTLAWRERGAAESTSSPSRNVLMSGIQPVLMSALHQGCTLY